MKMKHAFLAVAFATAGSGAVPAAAQQQAQSHEGIYAGVSVGRATARDMCSDPALGGAAGTTKCDNKDTTWRLLAGWQFNRNLALEIGYHDLGKSQLTNAGVDSEIRFKAWELVGVGILPVGGITSIYGKFGAFRGEAVGGGGAANTKSSKYRATYGAGVQFDVFRSFAVRGEWQRYPQLGGGGFNGQTDLSVFSISGLYKF